MVSLLWDVAIANGVNPVVLIAQDMNETENLKAKIAELESK